MVMVMVQSTYAVCMFALTGEPSKDKWYIMLIKSFARREPSNKTERTLIIFLKKKTKQQQQQQRHQKL